MEEKKKIKINFIWNTIGTTFNAFNSLFFLIIATRINGIYDAGIFSFAFSMACLFYIIGIYSGRVFQVTDNDKENDDFSYLNLHIITFLLMLVLGIVFCIIRGYTLYKFSIIMLLILYKGIEALSEMFYAVLQRKNDLYKVGISMFLKSLIGLILFAVIDKLTGNLIISIIFLIVTNILFLLLYDIKNSNIGLLKNYSFKKDIIRKLFIIGFFTFIFTFLNLYLINVSKYVIEYFMSDRYQTIFGIIIMPATVISLFAQFIIHPFLLKLKEDIVKEKYKELSRLVSKLVFLITLFGLFSIVCAYFFGIPVLNIIYGIDLSKYRLDLIIILLGATFYAITVVFNNILIAFRKTLSQAIVYFIMSIISTLISCLLIKKLGIIGASISYLITMFVTLVIFIIITYLVIKKRTRKEK